MKKKTLTERVEDDDRVEITPLIDVIFMLLLFFIVTTTFAEDTFFPIELPQAEKTVVRTASTTAVVEISHKGQFAVNQRPLSSRRRLYETLERLKEAGQARAVMIKADREAGAEHMVFVINVLKALEIEEFGVAAKRPGA